MESGMKKSSKNELNYQNQTFVCVCVCVHYERGSEGAREGGREGRKEGRHGKALQGTAHCS